MARVRPDNGDERQGSTTGATEQASIVANDEHHAAEARALEVETEQDSPAVNKKRSAHAPLVAEDGWDELALAPTPHNRTVYRMSGLGGDESALVAGALGYEGTMPGWLQLYLDEGTEAEPAIIAMFCEEFAKRRATFPELATLKADGVIAGYNAAEQQVQVWLEVGTSALVRGHCDDVVCVNPKSEQLSYAVLEVKKFRPTLWKVWTDKKRQRDFSADPVLEKYGWQCSALHHATGLPVYFVVGEFNPTTEQIDSVDVLLVSENTVPHSLAEIKARVMKAQRHVVKGEVPLCPHVDDSCMYAEFDFCPGKVEKEARDVDDVELGRLLALYHAYGVDASKTEDQKEAEKLRSAVKKQIDKLLADRGYARTKGDESGLMRVWSPTGDEFEFEWVSYEIAGRAATTGNKVNLKLVIEGAGVEAEDHPA